MSPLPIGPVVGDWSPGKGQIRVMRWGIVMVHTYRTAGLYEYVNGPTDFGMG
jgi:hypothetical protein